jgi:PIN domain nuclease of toxin-antitoxin system
MNRYVTDTHSLVWALIRNPRLSAAALSIFLEADKGQAIIIIPPIVIVEMTYLSEKGRIPGHLVPDLLSTLRTPNQSYQLAVTDIAVIEAVGQIPRASIPELPDRVISATAKALGLPLITRDSKITSSGAVTVIW